MNSKFTLIALMFVMLLASCSKDGFNEQDAIDAQTALLNLQYQHELDLETLRQKGATAMQELINTETLEQLKLTDSLAVKNATAAKRQDYSVDVVDVVTNQPIADADVTVSSEGKVISTKTNALGIAEFTALILYPTTPFLISKTGYAATQIIQQNLTSGSAKLWNTSDLSNEISGHLYIETDLTNLTTEKVGANVLVTASATIPTAVNTSYTVYFPAYTNSTGGYSIKLPAAPSGYNLSFQQIVADQKLFVNATEDDKITSFPNSLPRRAVVKTYFNVNQFNAGLPNVTNHYYFKVAPDKNGKVLYIQGYTYYNNNQVLLSLTDGKYKVARLYVNNNNGITDFNANTYEANAKVDVELIDVAGDLVTMAPKLSALADANGKLTYYTSPEFGEGYVHLKRDEKGALVANAKGVFKKAMVYDSFSNLYSLNFTTNLNTAANNYVNTSFLSPNKGDKKVIDFNYGSGDSREKKVY